MEYNKLYKIDSKGKTRVWWVERDGESYSVISGLLDGKKVKSKPKVAKGKNIGKVNETTPSAQAESEVQSLYEKQLDQGNYVDSLSKLHEVPKNFKPTLADKWEKWKNKVEYPLFVSPKLDGMRCIITKDGMFSRAGKPIVSAPHIFDTLVKDGVFEKYPDLVLDGELYNHEYKDDFNRIMSLVKKTKPTEDDLLESKKKIFFEIFDIFLGAEPSLPFTERQKFLLFKVANLFSMATSYIVFPLYSAIVSDEKELDDFYSAYIKQGYEGMMIRNGDSIYENKRTKNLLKRKDFEDEEFEILEILEGEGNWSSVAKHVRVKDKNTGEEFKSGMRGNYEFAGQLFRQRDEYVGGDVTIRFQGRTPDGIPRFPVAVAFYKEKRAI